MSRAQGKDAFIQNALGVCVVVVLGCMAFSALVPEHADATEQPAQSTETTVTPKATVTTKAPTSKTTGSLPMLATPSDKPAKKSQSGGGGGAGAN